MSISKPSLIYTITPGLVVCVIAGLVLVDNQQYSTGSQMVPSLVALVTIGLGLLDIISQFPNQYSRKLHAILSGARTDPDPEQSEESRGNKQVIVAFLWPAGFVALSWLFGFLLIIPLFLIAFLKLQGGKSLRSACVTAAIVSVVIWFLFEILMQYQIYRGIAFID